MNSFSVSKTLGKEFDRLPVPVRHFLGRRIIAFRLAKSWLLFQLIDRLALSFVRRGRSGAVFIVKNDALGDYVLFRNFLESVRAHPAYQDKPLILCGNIAIRDFAEAFDRGTVDRFLWLDPKAFLHRPFYRFKILREIKRIGASVALHPNAIRGLLGSHALIRASGAPERIGFISTRWGKIWNERFGWIDVKSDWERRTSNACFTRHLTFEALRFEFLRNTHFFSEVLGDTPLPSRPHLRPAAVALPDLPAAFVTIMPGSGEAMKEWPPEFFGTVAKHLHERHGLATVVAGTSADTLKAAAMNKEAGLNLLDLTGQLTLPQVVELLSRSVLVLTNDSGGIHLTAALGGQGIAVTGVNAGLIVFHPYPPEICDTVHFIYPRAVANTASVQDYAQKIWNDPQLALGVAHVKVEDVIAVVDKLLLELNQCRHEKKAT